MYEIEPLDILLCVLFLFDGASYPQYYKQKTYIGHVCTDSCKTSLGLKQLHFLFHFIPPYNTIYKYIKNIMNYVKRFQTGLKITPPPKNRIFDLRMSSPVKTIQNP